MTVACLVFDIDDTLYLEREYVRSGFHATGEWLQANRRISGLASLAWALFEEGARRDIFNRALSTLAPERSGDQPLIEQLVTAYRNHDPRIALLDDARWAIEQWSPRPMAIVTDGPLESQRRKASALQLETWMRPIVLTEALGAGCSKPSPAAFAAIERTLSVDGASCVYIGDNPTKDFAGPKALGWRTVRVRRPDGLHASLDSGPDVDAEISTLGELAHLGIL